MTEKRFGFIAVIGPPNAGKSTLSNALVGQKVAIVTHKAQTTRARLRAVVMHEQSQVVLVDTPGIFSGVKKLDKAMVQEAWSGAEEADAVLVVLDASRALPAETELVLAGVKNTSKPVILVLNKVDAVKREKLLELTQQLNEAANFADTFMVSALKETGLEELKSYLAQLVPEGPWHYPEDMAADVPSLLLAAEVTREKLFLRLHQELPYALTVETESWKRQKDGSVRLEQVIFVRRDSQKAIVLGKRGQSIREIGSQARLEMEDIFGHKVHLFLFVKVRDNWIDDPERLQDDGHRLCRSRQCNGTLRELFYLRADMAKPRLLSRCLQENLVAARGLCAVALGDDFVQFFNPAIVCRQNGKLDFLSIWVFSLLRQRQRVLLGQWRIPKLLLL